MVSKAQETPRERKALIEDCGKPYTTKPVWKGSVLPVWVLEEQMANLWLK